MSMLTGKQKKVLRAQGNQLKASVFVGKEGVTGKVCRFIEQALSNKELIKVKVLESRTDQFRIAIDKLSVLKDIEIAQVLGRTILLYRPLPDEQKKSDE